MEFRRLRPAEQIAGVLVEEAASSLTITSMGVWETLSAAQVGSGAESRLFQGNLFCCIITAQVPQSGPQGVCINPPGGQELHEQGSGLLTVARGFNPLTPGRCRCKDPHARDGRVAHCV